jgi:serine/threonine protein phosphatase 1
MTNKNRKTFVLTDIHGCVTELNLLLEQLPLTSESLIIFLGDYINRGENSREVIDTILQLREEYEVVTLKGNHEQMFIHFLEEKQTHASAAFIYNGGGATLASYSDDEGKYRIPSRHISFMTSLKLYHQTEDYFFVHAGLPNVKLHELDNEAHEKEMLCIRERFTRSSFSWEKVIIHGHTPVRNVEMTPGRINIDTGCVFGRKLTALQLPERILFSVPKQRKLNHAYLRDKNSRRKSVRFEGSLPAYLYTEEKLMEQNAISFDGLNTINLSEFGMLVFAAREPSRLVLSQGQRIAGHVGNEEIGLFYFEGIVVRCKLAPSAMFYGIQFTTTPFESSENLHFC